MHLMKASKSQTESQMIKKMIDVKMQVGAKWVS